MCSAWRYSWRVFGSYKLHKAAAWTLLGGPRLTHETPWLCKPVCFQVQFKLLVITFKALNGVGPGYLQNHPTSVGWAHSTHSGRSGLLWIPSVKELQLEGSKRKEPFLPGLPTLGNIMSLEMRSASHLPGHCCPTPRLQTSGSPWPARNQAMWVSENPSTHTHTRGMQTTAWNYPPPQLARKPLSTELDLGAFQKGLKTWLCQ